MTECSPREPQYIQTISLHGHPQPIAAKQVGQLDPPRQTIHRLELDAASAPRDFPKIIIVKQEKDGWEEEFQNEVMVYKRLQPLQGEVIPKSLGEGVFNDRPAILLSEVVGIPLHKLARDNTIGLDEEALQSGLAEALRALFIRDAKYWDQKLNNFLFCDEKERGKGKVMIVDLEQVTFPDNAPPWEEFARTWEGSMNFGTACALMRTFRRIRQSYCEPTPLGWTSGCLSHRNNKSTGDESGQMISAIDTQKCTEAPSYVLVPQDMVASCTSPS